MNPDDFIRRRDVPIVLTAYPDTAISDLLVPGRFNLINYGFDDPEQSLDFGRFIRTNFHDFLGTAEDA